MKGITRLAARFFAALFLIAGMAMTTSSAAVEGDLLWVTQAGGNSWDQGRGIALDSEGNELVVGYFYYSAVFGAGEPNETLLSSAGTGDIFVAKYDPSGALLWVTQAGGSGLMDWGNDIAVDAAGNSLVTGRFAKTATFGAGEPNETVLTAAGGDDIFVTKYDPDGALLWATQAGSDYDVTSTEEGNGITLDAVGNSLVTGRCTGTAIFGAGESNETVLSSCRGFIAKYDPDGVLLWAKNLGYGGVGVTLDAVGKILVTGFSGEELFVKFDEDGVLLGGTPVSGDFYGSSIAVDAAANIIVTGSFRGTAIFGAGEPNETLLTADDFYRDLFVAKFDPNGALLWVTQAGAEETNDGGFGAVDVVGNIMVAGGFGSTAIFGAGEPNETLLTANGLADIFVAKFDPDGALLWVTQAGGESVERPAEQACDIVVDVADDIIITGYFHLTAIFGADEPHETVLTATPGGVDDDYEDMFLAKYAGGGQVIDQPDLSLAMEADPSPFRVGRPWIYRLQVQNNGPGDATEVELTDILPERIKLLSIPEPCDQVEERILNCPLGSLRAGEGFQLEIQVRPKGPGVRFNAACVESVEPDLNEVDNCAELETLVELPLDILE